jgi:hypothetical protein
MSIKDTNQLRTQLLRNGYAVDTDGNLNTRREPDGRWSHTHLAVIRIDAPKEFTSKVLAALDEPDAVVGVSPTSAVMLFRVDDGGRYDASTHPFFRKEESSKFVLDGKKECLFTVTSTAQKLDVAAFTWRDGRSPSTTHRGQLPPLFLDVQHFVNAAIAAVLREVGGRFGALIVEKSPMELRLEKARAERAAREAAGIVEEEDTPESADEKLVAAHPDLRATDGPIGVLVHEARCRVDARNAAAREETARRKQDAKEQKAREKAMAEHLKQTA